MLLDSESTCFGSQKKVPINVTESNSSNSRNFLKLILRTPHICEYSNWRGDITSVVWVNDLGLTLFCEHKFHNEIKCLVSIYVCASVNIEHEMCKCKIL
jgi:hypothetical protein